MTVARDCVDVDPQRRIPVLRLASGEELCGCNEEQQIQQCDEAKTFEHGGCTRSERRVKHLAAITARMPFTNRVVGSPKKENPAVGTPGQVCCYRSLRFQVCGLAGARCATSSAEHFLLLSSRFFSCSSTFLFFSI